ncbi:MAG: response regulator [Spirochaetota bacterium]
MEETILIVEEHPDTLELLRRVLDKEGYKTLIATDGERGLDYARKFLPDLILMERLLTKMNGLQVCSKLKEGEETKMIPVIFLTMLDSENDIIEGLKAGADDYIKKPFSPDELLARIARVLSRYRIFKGENVKRKELKEISESENFKNKTIENVERYLLPFCRRLFHAVDIISDRLKKAEIKIHPYTDDPRSYYKEITIRIKKFDSQERAKTLKREIDIIAKLQSFLNRARKNLISLLLFTGIMSKIEIALKKERQGEFIDEVYKRQKEIHTLIEEIDLLMKKLIELHSLLAGLPEEL